MQRPAQCLVHLRSTEGVKFRALIETITPILVEGNVEFTELGMSIKGVNLIILLDMLIRANDVEDYVCNEKQRISINFLTLYTCLSSVGQDEAVCFQITEESKNACIPYMSVFIINNSDEEEYVFTFKVTLLALEKEDFEVPTTKFQSVVSIPSASFQRVLRCCEKRGNYVQICTRNQKENENYIIFATDGDDADLMYYTKFQVDPKTWEDRTCVKMDRYCLKYLMLITKATSLSSYVTLYLAHNFPLAIRYNIGTIGEIMFCLAPHVDESKFSPPKIISLTDIFKDDEAMIKDMKTSKEAKVTEKRQEEEVLDSPVCFRRMKLKDTGEKLRKKKRKKRKLNSEATVDNQKPLLEKVSLMSGQNLKGVEHRDINLALAPTEIPSVKESLIMPIAM
jgi:proliferating cell nuclear antigen PCNA